MPIDPALDSGWLAGLSDEERAKIILVDLEIFRKYGVAAASGLLGIVGGGSRLAVSRIIVPTVNVTPDGQVVPAGMVGYNDGTVWRLGRLATTAGTLRHHIETVGSDAVGGTYTSQLMSQLMSGSNQCSPYMSDGVTCQGWSTAISPMKSVSILVTAAGDGSVAAANLLGAGGAAVKNILFDINLSGGVTPDQTSTLFGVLTLSDGCGYIGRGGMRTGPIKQTTANTAITYSAGAGTFAANELLVLNVSYRAGS